VVFIKIIYYFLYIRKIKLTTMAKEQTSSSLMEKPKVTRAGVHAKTKTSKTKKAKNYKKPYKGQGR
jgi:hypothetical protein